MKSIIEEIGGDVFCLLVDESADVSGKEQMAVVVRYVDKLGVIKERLIGIVHVKETSASCLKSNIDNVAELPKLSRLKSARSSFKGIIQSTLLKRNKSGSPSGFTQTFHHTTVP